MNTTYVAVDVETTGLDAYEDAIIEVAAVVFRGDEILEEWSSLVDPGRELPPEITSLTGIQPAMLADAPSIFSLRTPLRRMLADHVIVGHNVGFDMGFLEQAHIGAGQHRIDTITLASILLPAAGRYSLDALGRHLELPNPRGRQDHRALGDARRTVDLFLALYARAQQLEFGILSEIVETGRRLGWPETRFFEDALSAAGRTAFGQSPGRVRKLFNPPKLAGHSLNPLDNLQSIDADTIAGMLRPGGNFSRAFPDYEFRPQQVQMVAAVAHAFNNQEHLIVEAGTGTGKSVGYLLPAAFFAHENERCVVISTNTINLQDQLLHKDIPALQQLLPFELRATVLKGKRNYLCTRLFQQMRHGGPASADEMVLYARILNWLPTTESGDVSEIAMRTPGERLAWDRLSADNDGCRADICREEKCPLHMARRRAEQAHLVIANHSLVLADVATGNRVLPPYGDLIVDEAHHLEAAVTDGLSFRADRRFLETLLEEITRPRAGLLGEVQGQIRAVDADVARRFDGYVNVLRNDASLAQERLGEFFEAIDYFLQDHVRATSQFAQQVRLLPAMRNLETWEEVVYAWENLNNVLTAVVKGLSELLKNLDDFVENYEVEDGEALLLTLQSLGQKLAETRLNLHHVVADPAGEMIYWVELHRRRVSLNAAPLHIGPLVEKYIFNEKDTVILTSATLRTAGRGGSSVVNFDYLRERLYAHDCSELAVGSPFNYKNSTLLYLVSDMPEPNQPGYQRYVESAIVAVARALGGRTMVLFTAYGQLVVTGRAIAQPLAEAGLTLLQQTEGSSRQQLLAQFKAPDSRAVLLGTRSFWEGVDVPGRALQAVIIAKLPFDVPSDPIFAARSETFENPFFDYAIPEAVLRFRQGFGRLIRRRDDEGVVVILDKRLLTKRYGQSFLDALPECVVVRQRHNRLEELVLRWLNREREDSA